MILGHPAISDYFASVFGAKVQKIAVDAGLGCPNRDGTVGSGGCIFCNNDAFCPGYARGCTKSITQQLADGLEFFRRKGGDAVYLAYFQTYSNTYGDTQKLIALYEEALAFPGVKGLVLATRPDCLKEDLMDWFQERFGNKAAAGHPHLLVEIGVESTKDSTLEAINRGHSFSCAQNAIRELDARGIDCGVHIILGLPGEGHDDFIMHAGRISALPVKTIKLHHLQVVANTALERMYREGEVELELFSPESYAAQVRAFLGELRADIAVDRLVNETPKAMVVAPCWGLKPSEFNKYLL